MSARSAGKGGYRAALLLAALALFLRAMIPSGWMPAAGRIALIPCPGAASAEASSAIGMSHHASAHHGGHAGGDKAVKPCGYVAFGCALAEPDAPDVSAPAIMPTLILRVALAGLAVGAGLAAPPPPPTGPPATV